jgi:hypothetical protein
MLDSAKMMETSTKIASPHKLPDFTKFSNSLIKSDLLMPVIEAKQKQEYQRLTEMRKT